MINPGNLSETLMLQTCKIFLLIRLQMFVIILTLQQFILIKDVGKSYIIKIEYKVVTESISSFMITFEKTKKYHNWSSCVIK